MLVDDAGETARRRDRASGDSCDECIENALLNVPAYEDEDKETNDQRSYKKGRI
jgi:hypothetical protein